MTPKELQTQIDEYRSCLEEHQITEKQYLDLLKGIKLEEKISTDVEGIKEQEEAREILVSAIKLAEMALKI